MAHKIDKLYGDAVASGLLPGVSIFAGDKNGNLLYSKSIGKASMKEGRDLPFTDSTICIIASMTKLMTSVAVVQCVEQGKLDLDQDVRPMFPEMGRYGIISGFDDRTNQATFAPNDTPITLRMLLSHTSGHEYEWFNPLLEKWRASRGEEPWGGRTVADKLAVPLVFTPGTGFAYGAGHDWAGKAVEIATGITLEEFMRQHIWEPLGIENDVSFFPEKKENMKDRLADMSTLSDEGKPPATDVSDFDIRLGATDCLGGAGIFISPAAFYTFLSAVFRRDGRLMKPDSYAELFRPQLNSTTEQAFNDYLDSSAQNTEFLALGIPSTVRKTFSFAGMVTLSDQEGRSKKGTTYWAGLPGVIWFMDHEAGTYGTVFCQILPPMYPPILALHVEFQKAVLEIAEGK